MTRNRFGNFGSFPALILTVVLSFILHASILNKDIVGVHSWRQSQTMLNIRNFYRYDATILNPRVAHFNGGKDNLYRYEFPYMQWLISRMQILFGEDILFVRLFMFAVGVFSLLALHQILRLLFKDEWGAALGVWALAFSPVFYYYMVNPLPDNMALCMGLWYIYFFIRSTESNRWLHHVPAAFFLSMATLAKLPFIVLGGATLSYLVVCLRRNGFKQFRPVVLLSGLYLLLMLPAFAWYAWVIPGWKGNGVVSGIFDNPISFEQAMGILTYHANTMFPERLMNPVSVVFMFVGLYGFFKHRLYQSSIGLGLMVAALAVWCYFFLELNMIGTVHDYYMMPFLPFLYIALTAGLLRVWKKDRLLRIAVMVSLVLMPVQCLWQLRNYWTPEIVSNMSNPNLTYYQQELKQAVPDHEKCIVLNDVSSFIFLYLIDKQGYVFNNDHLPTEWIHDVVANHNVRYMYSDSRAVDERPDVQPYLAERLMERGNIRVFRLKLPEQEK